MVAYIPVPGKGSSRILLHTSMKDTRWGDSVVQRCDILATLWRWTSTGVLVETVEFGEGVLVKTVEFGEECDGVFIARLSRKRRGGCYEYSSQTTAVLAEGCWN